MPKKKQPIIIIVPFIIKLDIETFILKCFFNNKLKTVIPPEEKFILYIIPPVKPQITPAVIDVIKMWFLINEIVGIKEVILMNNG